MTTTDTENKTIPEISVDSLEIYKRLQRLEVGEIVTYEELGSLIGADVQNGARGRLETARKKLLREDQRVVECVRGIGVKRLDDAGVVEVLKGIPSKVSRIVRRSKKKLATVHPENLTQEGRKEYAFSAAAIGTLEMFSKPSALKKIEQHAHATGGTTFDATETLRLFAPK